MKFRKKPVVVEAIQFKSGMYSEPLVKFFGDTEQEISFSHGHGDDVFALEIKTLEGDLMVSHGDWIIKGVNGEFYPCKPDIFEMTYEAVRRLNKSRRGCAGGRS